jgi:hypothetical protein
MTGVELSKTQTKVDPAELRSALRLAWWALFNDDPTRETLSVLLAQWAQETGRGKACWNNNLGNQKYPAPPVELGSLGDWQFYACAENRKDGSQYWIYPPNRGCCFQAFRTLRLGALAYLGLLARRYRRSWDALCSGDPARFVEAIRAQGYFTGDLDDYRRGVVSLWHEYMRLPPLGAVTDDEQTEAGEFTYQELLERCRAAMAAERDAG